jgi:PTH1 family peptidyl-tRNA hydrolase
VALLKPSTFMNFSGSSVQMAMESLKLDAPSVIVLHDELDLGFGVLRVKVGGGHAGHNGLRSLMERISSSEFVRVRIGVSRPPADFRGDVGEYVLSGFDPIEQASLPGVIEEAVDAVQRILRSGPSAAMNEVNPRSSEKK